MTDEFLDVVDSNDKPIGREKRKTVHARGLWHRGVHVFLFTPEGKLLIQKRHADKRQYASLWDCSVSEHVQAGEDYSAAAQRGLWEELGLRDVILTPCIRFRLNYGPNDNEVSVLFTGLADPARVRFDRGEIERVDFRLVDELLKEMEAGGSAFCGWFIQMLRWYTGRPSDLILLPLDSVR